MFHLAAYSESIVAAAVNSDLAAVSDGEFTVRNDHLIFTDPIQAIGTKQMGVGMLNPRFNVPTLNAIGRHMLFPIDRSATIPSPGNFSDYRDFPLAMPLNEDVAIEVSNDDAADQIQNVFLFLAPPGWNRNIPRGLARLTLRATAAVAGIAQAWSTEGNLTFAENIKGGWYSIVGCHVFDAGTLAFRLIFPNGNIYGQRRMRPGGLAQQTIDGLPTPFGDKNFGEWGRFHSFEPCRLQILANATGASTQEIRLEVVYQGESGGVGR